MQSVRSRIWTRVDVSISYDNNDYTTGTSRTTTPRAPPERLHHGHLYKVIPPQNVLNMKLDHMRVRFQPKCVLKMRSIPSLPLFAGPLWSGMVAPFRVSNLGKIKLFRRLIMSKQMTNVRMKFSSYIAIRETIYLFELMGNVEQKYLKLLTVCY